MQESALTELIKLALLLATTFISYMNNRQGKIIHTLVNSKMTTALQRIDELERELKSLRNEPKRG
jgi:hypothetical protein